MNLVSPPAATLPSESAARAARVSECLNDTCMMIATRKNCLPSTAESVSGELEDPIQPDLLLGRIGHLSVPSPWIATSCQQFDRIEVSIPNNRQTLPAADGRSTKIDSQCIKTAQRTKTGSSISRAACLNFGCSRLASESPALRSGLPRVRTCSSYC